jgi:AmpD protein
MHIDTQTGLLAEARQQPSPNCDQRPADTTIDLLVIHAISLPEGEFGGPWIDQLFCNELEASDHDEFNKICDLKVSSHILIRRDGELVQYVPFQGCDDQAFDDIQYQRLSELANELMKHYPDITQERITGHSEIAPGRKTDPGPLFDWEEFRRLFD